MKCGPQDQAKPQDEREGQREPPCGAKGVRVEQGERRGHERGEGEQQQQKGPEVHASSKENRPEEEEEQSGVF